MALVLDTGPLLAGLDRDDKHHRACRALIAGSPERRVIPAPVLPELDHFCRAHLGPDAFPGVLRDIRRGRYSVEDLRGPDYERVEEILAEYRDLRVGFVDAAVLAIVERLGEPKLATLDRRHFGAMRPRHIAALELLPGP